MDTTQPSRSALDVAIHRAVHQLLDYPLIFDDPLALAILGPKTATALRNNIDQLRANHELRAFTSVRSRYAEDRLARAVAQGVLQYVVLGAGLDTFAYRTASSENGLRIFEVDIPSTQQWKRHQLNEAQITVPGSLTFVGVDFENQSLPDRLQECGFDSSKPAVFSVLGVVVFLAESTAKETFAFVASLPRGSRMVFDYGVADNLLSDEQRRLRELSARQLASFGEPLLTFFDPHELEKALLGMGYTQVEDLGATEINDRYFSDRSDGLDVGRCNRRVICASR